MSDDDEIGELLTGEFDDSGWGSQSWSQIGEEDVQRLTAADRTIRAVTTNSYIKDIYTDATNLRNVLGDMDGIAAEIATSIRRNILVIAATIKKKPHRLIIDAVRTLPLEQAIPVLEECVGELTKIIDAGNRALASRQTRPEGDREVAAGTANQTQTAYR